MTSIDKQPAAGAPTLALFTVTMFTGAALLFWIQPLFAKMVLPLLGGSPQVWNTAMVFFQAVLLAGYAYAHWLTRALPAAAQMGLHAGVLALAALFLPLAVAAGWEPDPAGAPVVWLLALLGASIGLPFFAVSATAPLLQRWFSRTGHAQAHDPYFLYGASNLGSVIALLGYPLLLEPALSGQAQSLAWTLGYGLLAVLVLTAGVRMLGGERQQEVEAEAVSVTWRQHGSWTIYSAVPSALLLGVTAHISTDIAAVPLLWVVPLTLYLLTFVIVFARRPAIRHSLAVRLQPIAAVLLVALFLWRNPAMLLLPLHLFAFFLTALMCHGELARRRPPAAALTEFYLFMSIGGVLGGMFTALLAPLIFTGVWEYPIAIAAACALLPAARRALSLGDVIFAAAAFALLLAIGEVANDWFDANTMIVGALAVPILALLAFPRRRRPLGFGLSIAAILAGALLTMVPETTLFRARSFFGIYRVAETDDGKFRMLYHGPTLHGGQRLLPGPRYGPIAYYTQRSPVAEVMRKAQANADATRMGLVGLGAGSLACYYRPGDDWRFYEIDPLVAELASDGRFFALVPACVPEAPIILGDARLTLAREPSEAFQVLVVDAFSSDSIPMHLLTTEAMALYFDKLTDDGVLVLHISNQFLDLRPVVSRIAKTLGLVGMVGLGPGGTEADGPYGDLASLWIALARKPAVLDRLGLGEHWWPLPAADGTPPWTDDHSNILEIIRWGGLNADEGR